MEEVLKCNLILRLAENSVFSLVFFFPNGQFLVQAYSGCHQKYEGSGEIYPKTKKGNKVSVTPVAMVKNRTKSPIGVGGLASLHSYL